MHASPVSPGIRLTFDRTLNVETTPRTRARVLFVSYTSDFTGPTRSLRLLLLHLRSRFDLVVLLPGRGEFRDILEQDGVTTVSLPSLGKRAIPAMIRLIRRERFTLVYGNNTGGASRHALIAAKVARVPFVAHVRAMARRRLWLKLSSFRFADAVIAVSAASARAIAPYLGGRIPEVVYNGVELAEVPTIDREQARRLLLEAGVEGNSKIVLSVSHVCPRKGQAHAVEVMRRVVAEEPRAVLVMVGALDRDPEYVRRVRARIGELGLSDRVLLLGYRRDTLRLMRGADVFLHTAVVDPHPRAVIEAMAAELPVVAFGVDGVSETVSNGESGLLAPPGDIEGLARALTGLIAHPETVTAFGHNGRRRAEARFSAEGTARSVGEIIEHTLARRAARHGKRPTSEAVEPDSVRVTR